MRRWQCTVCGYIHKGEEPPEQCPVCGADKSQFEEIDPEPAVRTPDTAATSAAAGGPAPGATPQPVRPAAIPAGPRTRLDQIHDLMVQYHAHPIAVHVPNGLLPISVFFIFLAILFKCDPLATAAKYNMLMVFLAMPLVVYSGLTDWKRRFGGKMTLTFRIKMVCAGVVSALAPVITLWMFVQPGITQGGAKLVWLFLLLNLILLGAAATAGYYGGKLIIFPGDSRE